jgi:hypothetical protein
MLAHDHVDGAFPGPVVAAELGVLQAVTWVILSILHPQQLQGDARPAQLPVQVFIVRFGPPPRRTGVARIEAGIELGFGEPLGLLIGKCRHRSSGQGIAHRASRAGETLCDLAGGEARFLQSEHICDLAHRQPLSRHRRLPSCLLLSRERVRAGGRYRRGLGRRAPAGGRNESESVAGFNRNRWPE